MDGKKEQRPTVAVVGCGSWGKNLVRNFSALGALGAVCDSKPGLAAQHAREFGSKARSFDEVLADEAIAGVVIATPAETHAALAGQAIAAKKHVFVEKPLALSIEDGEALVAKARAADRVLMAGHLLHYHPAFQRVLKLAEDGTLGRLQYIYSNRLNLGKIRREENVFWSFAPHDISMILALAGEVPSKVHATGSYYLHTDIADVTTTTLEFPGGIHAHIFVSWLHPFKDQKLVVIGDRGMAVFNDCQPWQRKLVLYRHRIEWKEGMPAPLAEEGEPVPLEEAEPLRLECAHFLECIAKQQRPRTDGAEGLRVLRVLTAAQQSMNEGREISLAAGAASKVAPKAEFFVHATACVDDGVRIGLGTRIWHFSHILEGTSIGEHCIVGQNAMIGPEVRIGNGCKIQNNVSIYKGVELEDDVFCGPSCVFTNVLNPRAHVERKDEFRTTIVERGATIGANATILCGHRLGAYCMVAAGAVVTKDVVPHALVAGVPARRIGWVSHDGERLGRDLVCPRSGRRYAEDVAGNLVARAP